MLIKKKDEMSVSPETLSFSEYREKHEVGIATIVKHYDWVKAKSRDIDIEKELPIARDLDKIMRYFREKHTFVGVSSNNIYWNVTRIPIRQILVPAPKRQYITLINPKIMKLEGEDNHYVEACGSIPGKIYAVKRKSYVSISGFTLEKQYIDLEYGSKKYYSGGELIYSAYSHQEWIIQHEMDHLDGITIADKATKLIWEFS